MTPSFTEKAMGSYKPPNRGKIMTIPPNFMAYFERGRTLGEAEGRANGFNGGVFVGFMLGVVVAILMGQLITVLSQ